MDDLRRRWNQIKEQIEAACRRSGRDPRDVRVVAVTKYVDTDMIRQVLDIGLRDIGESRVQEAVPKWSKYLRSGIMISNPSNQERGQKIHGQTKG